MDYDDQQSAFDGGVNSDGGISLPGGVSTSSETPASTQTSPSTDSSLAGAGTVRTDVGSDGMPEAIRAPGGEPPGAIAAAGADAAAAHPAPKSAAPDPCKAEREKMEDSSISMTTALGKASLLGELQNRTEMVQGGAFVSGTMANPTNIFKEGAAGIQKSLDAQAAAKVAAGEASGAMLQNATNVRRYNACMEANRR